MKFRMPPSELDFEYVSERGKVRFEIEPFCLIWGRKVQFEVTPSGSSDYFDLKSK